MHHIICIVLNEWRKLLNLLKHCTGKYPAFYYCPEQQLVLYWDVFSVTRCSKFLVEQTQTSFCWQLLSLYTPKHTTTDKPRCRSCVIVSRPRRPCSLWFSLELWFPRGLPSHGSQHMVSPLSLSLWFFLFLHFCPFLCLCLALSLFITEFNLLT